MRIFFALFFATAYTVAAQTPQVPHKMQFAGITLTIRDDARREIQKDVNALTQSPRHHNIKVERAKTYFPIIEKVFEEERVPDDFKYLVLQESALIADAVSTSNAVGFWQFKDFTAVEMGLRVDKVVDERLNIVSSTRAAARYIKKNNFYFNNWVYALQAYQMGAGGVMKSVRETQAGLKHLEITSHTYWYVKKFLAHKIAFEQDVKGAGRIQVLTYQTKSKKHLSEIAKEVDVNEDQLKEYNKWAKNGTIPDDRMYAVMIPLVGEAGSIKIPDEAVATTVAQSTTAAAPRAAGASQKVSAPIEKINGIAVVKAKAGEKPAELASRAGADLSDFLKWNDISISDRIETDQYYLLGKKRARGIESYHKVAHDDNLWKISQRYGLQLKKLKKYNRISSDRELTPGLVLWLNARKPAYSDEAVPAEDIVQVDNTQPFAWTLNPGQAEAALIPTPLPEELPKKEETTLPVQAEEPDSTQAEASIAKATGEVITQDAVEPATISVVVPERRDEHVVLAGETLYGIANKHKVGVMDLVRWNHLNLSDGIKPGQVIKLVDDQPLAAEKKVASIEHEVKSTDTLYSVARKYNVTIQELMEWNDKKDFNLSVGEKLTIRSK
jgi:membrane-bound lytic murein transglycosylase D